MLQKGDDGLSHTEGTDILYTTKGTKYHVTDGQDGGFEKEKDKPKRTTTKASVSFREKQCCLSFQVTGASRADIRFRAAFVMIENRSSDGLFLHARQTRRM